MGTTDRWRSEVEHATGSVKREVGRAVGDPDLAGRGEAQATEAKRRAESAKLREQLKRLGEQLRGKFENLKGLVRRSLNK